MLTLFISEMLDVTLKWRRVVSRTLAVNNQVLVCVRALAVATYQILYPFACDF